MTKIILVVLVIAATLTECIVMRKQTLRAVLLYKQIRQQHGIRPTGKPHDNFSRLRQIIPHAGEDVLSFHDAQLPAM